MSTDSNPKEEKLPKRKYPVKVYILSLILLAAALATVVCLWSASALNVTVILVVSVLILYLLLVILNDILCWERDGIVQGREGTSAPRKTDDGTDLIASLWTETLERGKLLLSNISKTAFIVFIFCVTGYWWVSTQGAEYEEAASFLLALATTMFTIWLVQIIYSSQMDEVHEQKMNQMLMRIF